MPPQLKVVFQLKITLQGIRPPIWRRILTPASFRLSELHQVIQAAMGWHNGHLHAFNIHGCEYGDPSLDPLGDLDLEDERKARLSSLDLGPGSWFAYQYDFGDDWQHRVLVEKVLPADPAVAYPVCVTGKRACPPEDCGGAWRYPELLEALRDPENPEHEEMVEWMDASFDPEAFDLEWINASLRTIWA